MKKLIFTLMMMAMLAMMANTAFAQPSTSVIPGSTYDYTLSDVQILHLGSNPDEATVTFAYVNGGTNATFSDVNHNGPIALNANVGILTSTTSDDLTFKVAYGEGASLATSGDISVTIKDGTPNGCSNNIILTITVQPVPSILASLVLGAGQDASICQDTDLATNNSSAADNSTDANTITFTLAVNPSNPPATYNGTLDISFTDLTGTFTDLTMTGNPVGYSDGGTGLSGTVTWDQSSLADASGDFTFTFSTVEGITHTDFVGLAANVTITDTDPNLDSSVDYTEDGGALANNTATVEIKTMPSIGTFQ